MHVDIVVWVILDTIDTLDRTDLMLAKVVPPLFFPCYKMSKVSAMKKASRGDKVLMCHNKANRMARRKLNESS